MTLNETGHAEAVAVTEAIQRDLEALLAADGPGAVIGSAPAGGGKTHFIVATTVDLTRRLGRRVVVVTPTNKQVEELLERLLDADLEVAFLHAASRDGDLFPTEPGFSSSTSWEEVKHSPVIVSTVSKLGFALVSDEWREEDAPDVLLVDEAYQVKAADYLCVAAASRVHLLVGDPGQLDPFSTLGDVDWWRGRSEDPLTTAVTALKRYHPSVVERKFPLTRRLDDRGAAVAQAFYPDLDFAAYVPEGVRSLIGTYPPPLERLGKTGWARVVLPPEGEEQQVADAIADAAAALLAGTREVVDERGTATLEPSGLMVGVSRNQQRLMVEAALERRGIPLAGDTGADGVRVLTANKAQGLQTDVTLVWHPLAGEREADPFKLDPGRLCVLMTRHRHGCVVFGREGDERLVDGIPPETSAYADEDAPLLVGWYVHQRLYTALEERS